MQPLDEQDKEPAVPSTTTIGTGRADVPTRRPILFSVSEGVARITLNRPERLNAFDPEMARAWSDATEQATTRDDVRAVLIDASGPSFCAGGDVHAMADMASGEALRELAETINEGVIRLTTATVPVVAAAPGTTAGGGLGILLASDYAIVSTDSRIGALYGKIGLTPDLSVTAQLARAVGERRALQLVLRDDLIPADQALGWGLVAEVVSPGMLAKRARLIAAEWSAASSRARGHAKRLIREAVERPMAVQMAEEARTIGAAFDTVEATALISEFAGRSRRPAR